MRTTDTYEIPGRLDFDTLAKTFNTQALTTRRSTSTIVAIRPPHAMPAAKGQ